MANTSDELQIKIRQSKILKPDLKKKILAVWSKLNSEQKERLAKAAKAEEQIIALLSKAKNLSRKTEKEVREEAEAFDSGNFKEI